MSNVDRIRNLRHLCQHLIEQHESIMHLISDRIDEIEEAMPDEEDYDCDDCVHGFDREVGNECEDSDAGEEDDD